MTTTGAPAYRYRTMTIETATRRGLRGETFTADELREFLPADGSAGVLWTSMGAAGGSREVFGTERVRVGAEGLETVTVPEGCSELHVIMVRPFGQGRTVRVLTRKPLTVAHGSGVLTSGLLNHDPHIDRLTRRHIRFPTMGPLRRGTPPRAR